MPSKRSPGTGAASPSPEPGDERAEAASAGHPVSVRIRPAPDPVDPDLEPLLAEPFASAWAAGGAVPSAPARALRSKLLARLAESRAASATMVTSRLKRLAATAVAPGVAARTLYEAPHDRRLRPGEPLRTRLIDLQPGSQWPCPDAAGHREWLVLRGSVRIGDAILTLRDYHVVPAGISTEAVVAAEDGAWLFLRESALPAAPGAASLTVRDAEAGWPDYAPGIQRRVLWQRDGQAALLYHAQPGAAVPQHSHGHDEECLMLQGELFLDDVLLQAGDYQLAPAGTGHRLTETDTGVVIYAHGDLDLKFTG
jgi:quercetin dioxygenase-like cupin family protein